MLTVSEEQQYGMPSGALWNEILIALTRPFLPIGCSVMEEISCAIDDPSFTRRCDFLKKLMTAKRVMKAAWILTSWTAKKACINKWAVISLEPWHKTGLMTISLSAERSKQRRCQVIKKKHNWASVGNVVVFQSSCSCGADNKLFTNYWNSKIDELPHMQHF